jgi:hypothetical protein
MCFVDHIMWSQYNRTVTWKLLGHCRRKDSQKQMSLALKPTHPCFRSSTLTRMIPHFLRVNPLHVYRSLLALIVSRSYALVMYRLCNIALPELNYRSIVNPMKVAASRKFRGVLTPKTPLGYAPGKMNWIYHRCFVAYSFEAVSRTSCPRARAHKESRRINLHHSL